MKRRAVVRKGIVPPRLKKLLKDHVEWRLGNCLNLLASENFSSPAVREMLSTDLSNRYTSPEGFYMGTKYIDAIQIETEELAKDVFGAKYADVRPLSGHATDMILLTGLTRPNDKVMVVDKAFGGYPGISQDAFPKLYGLQICTFPFDKRQFNIDVTKAPEAIQQESPKLVIFGASMILFPQPVQALADSCKAVGAKVAFDGSHVLGLIAGKQFQDPLREGASVLVGSTHKSLFGPQGGMILANEYEDQLRNATYPSIVDNAHWNRIAALHVALYEAKRFGKQYASQVIKNSRTLAKALDDHGIALLAKDNGFTRSHQTIVEVPSEEQGTRMARRLEEANIIVDSGIRIGTTEETRRGMRQTEMDQIAELIARVWIHNENPKSIRKDVRRLRQEFSSIRFC